MGERRYQKIRRKQGSSLACGRPPPNTRSEACRVTAQGRSSLNSLPPKPAARSRLIIGEFGPSDSALAAASGWRLRHPAADQHAARCASRDLCSGVCPSALYALGGFLIAFTRNRGKTSNVTYPAIWRKLKILRSARKLSCTLSRVVG